MIHDLSKSNSLVNTFVSELRNVSVQKDKMRFRKNVARIGQIFAYEISKTISYVQDQVETPLGIAEVQKCTDRVVVASILRAGLPLHNGVLDFFDHAENAFISAYRVHHKDGSFEIRMEYITCPNLTDTVLILADPMLATGASMGKTIEALKSYGIPKTIHVVSVIAARAGLEYINRLFPDVHIWLGALDEELTAKSYIVPGLGDAGDLSYGAKVQE